MPLTNKGRNKTTLSLLYQNLSLLQCGEYDMRVLFASGDSIQVHKSQVKGAIPALPQVVLATEALYFSRPYNKGPRFGPNDKSGIHNKPSYNSNVSQLAVCHCIAA